jgi:hypothetical protein
LQHIWALMTQCTRDCHLNERQTGAALCHMTRVQRISPIVCVNIPNAKDMFYSTSWQRNEIRHSPAPKTSCKESLFRHLAVHRGARASFRLCPQDSYHFAAYSCRDDLSYRAALWILAWRSGIIVDGIPVIRPFSINAEIVKSSGIGGKLSNSNATAVFFLLVV